MCSPTGIRVYDGSDNEGTTMQERTAHCGAACFNKKTATGNGPWSDKADAVGFSVNIDGRCYCNHEAAASCTWWHCTCYTAYEFMGAILPYPLMQLEKPTCPPIQSPQVNRVDE